MADQRESGIAWTDETWNPTRGCSRVDSGCLNCYAEGVARRFSGPGQPYEGLVRLEPDGKARAQWNGTVRVVPARFFDPLRWERPRRVFVNSMSDVFHESLDFGTIAAIFGVMASAGWHTFQVLTKRPERALAFFDHLRALERGPLASCLMAALDFERDRTDGDALHATHCADPGGMWPLPNVQILVSVSDQASADERIPILLQLDAATRGVSYEPALGPVRFDGITDDEGTHYDALRGSFLLARGLDPKPLLARGPRLDWIIVGGESGPGARPFNLAWARSTVAACAAAGVACFVKQLGARPVTQHPMLPRGNLIGVKLTHRAGADPAEWSDDLRVRQFPGGAT